MAGKSQPSIKLEASQSVLARHGCKIIPFFTSSSILSSYTFYTEKLGMKGNMHPAAPETPTFASLLCGEKACVNFYVVKQDKDGKLPLGRCMIMLESLAALGDLREELVTNGLTIVEGDGEIESVGGPRMGKVEDKDWGYRQFDLWDQDGNQIVFFAFLER